MVDNLGSKAEGLTYHNGDGEMEAHDQLPEHWRQRLKKCSVKFSSKEILIALENRPESVVEQLFEQAVQTFIDQTATMNEPRSNIE